MSSICPSFEDAPGRQERPSVAQTLFETDDRLLENFSGAERVAAESVLRALFEAERRGIDVPSLLGLWLNS